MSYLSDSAARFTFKIKGEADLSQSLNKNLDTLSIIVQDELSTIEFDVKDTKTFNSRHSSILMGADLKDSYLYTETGDGDILSVFKLDQTIPKSYSMITKYHKASAENRIYHRFVFKASNMTIESEMDINNENSENNDS